MEFHILTLFPQMLEPYFNESILGRAQKAGLIRMMSHDLRYYATNKHKSVDDRPYGGGAGMVLRPEVLVAAVRDLKVHYPIDEVILTSPRGKILNHEIARGLSHKKSILLICGRYEGIDQRAIDLVVDREISIGDYVITGGELASQIIADAVSRFIPGVLGDSEGVLFESHADGLLEYPHYTRPDIFEDLSVPQVLLSGDHAKIEAWRKDESLKITQKNRPDLMKK